MSGQCGRFMPLRETYNGTEMWTCMVCRCTFEDRETFDLLERCQRR